MRNSIKAVIFVVVLTILSSVVPATAANYQALPAQQATAHATAPRDGNPTDPIAVVKRFLKKFFVASTADPSVPVP